MILIKLCILYKILHDKLKYGTGHHCIHTLIASAIKPVRVFKDCNSLIRHALSKVMVKPGPQWVLPNTILRQYLFEKLLLGPDQPTF